MSSLNLEFIRRKKALEVYQLAAKAHEGQERLPGVPYIVHPVSVSSMVLQYKFGPHLENAFFTALLHDTVEDTKLTINDIRSVTNNTVAEAVGGLTKNPEIKGKEAQLKDSVERCLKVGYWVLAVKALDRVDNLNPATIPDSWFTVPGSWLDEPKHSWGRNYAEESFLIQDAVEKHRDNEYDLLHPIEKTLCRALVQYRRMIPVHEFLMREKYSVY